MSEFLRRLRYYFRRGRFEAELEEEMAHHASLANDFGNMARLKEDSRSMWGWTAVEQLGQDLRYAVRAMFNNRVFTLLAILSLALGIGANTAIYSFIDSILIRSLPVSEPESLVTLNWNTPPSPDEKANEAGPKEPPVVRLVFQASLASYFDPQDGLIAAYFPYAAFEMFEREGSPFQSVFAYLGGGVFSVLADGQTEVIEGNYVSGGYFAGLGVIPAAGRFVAPGDDRAGAPVVAVLSHNYWTRRFGASTGVIGRTISVNKTPVTIVGVAPPEFFGVDAEANPDLYVPLHSNLALNAGTPMGNVQGWYTNPNFYWVEMMARLKPGVNRTQAQAAMAPRFHDLAASTASTDEERAVLPSLVIKEAAAGLDTLRRRYSQPLYLLLTLVGLILAIACANIASLLLARAAARRREMAVRLSMGASRWRVIRQLLTESVLLASLGGALGVPLAFASIRFLTVLLANGRENFTLRAALNWDVLAATAGISILAGILFGLAPALQSTRQDVMPALKASRTDSAGGLRRGRFRVSLGQILLAGQIAISLLLLVAAGLFVRTLSNLESTYLGFNQDNLLLFSVNPRDAGLPAAALPRFYQDLRDRLAGLPGVRQASYSNLSLVGGGSMSMRVSVPGMPENRAAGLYVGPSFFETMQIPIRAGRAVDERDGSGASPVAVVNELFAKTYFGNENAIGRTFGSSAASGPVEIVGVAANARYGSLKEDLLPVVYVAAANAIRPQVQMTYEVRTAGNAMALANTVRELVRQAGERIAVTRIRTQSAQIDGTINQEIVFARLCTGFAALALLIACVGLYASTTYSVARRTGEIGIRMALGAQRGRVFRMVLLDIALLSAIGLAIGLPTAMAASRLVGSFLFAMEPNDPWALAGAVLILLAAALIASLAPARRASRIDPMAALRHE